MSKFYGTVSGMAKTEATRRGGRDITVAAQSWDGSQVTRLYYNDEGELCIRVETYHDSRGSFSWGAETMFDGTFAEYEKILRRASK